MDQNPSLLSVMLMRKPGGSDRFRPLLDDGALIGCRSFFVAWCLTFRRRLFSLGEDKWIPAANSPRYMVELLRLYGVRLGALLERCDSAFNPPPVNSLRPRRAQDLRAALTSLTKLEEELIGWFHDYEVGFDDQLYCDDPTLGEADMPTTVGFNFYSNDVGYQLLQYWDLRLIISMNVADVCQKLAMQEKRDRGSDALPMSYVTALLGTKSPSVLLDSPVLTLGRFVAVHTPAKRIDLAKKMISNLSYTTRPEMGLEMVMNSTIPSQIALAELSIHPECVSISEASQIR